MLGLADASLTTPIIRNNANTIARKLSVANWLKPVEKPRLTTAIKIAWLAAGSDGQNGANGEKEILLIFFTEEYFAACV